MPIDDQSALNMDPYGGDPDPEGEEQQDISEDGQHSQEPDDKSGNKEDDLISDLLIAFGISDPSKIKFEDDNGKIVEKDWKSLSKSEKLNILQAGQPEAEYNNEETSFIQHVRDNGMSIADYVNSLINEAVSQNTPEPHYEVEDFSDDELFVLDTLSKYGEENVTDEQLEKLLNDAKSDPELYAKTIESLRNFYRTREDETKLYDQQQYEAQQEEQYGRFSDNILNEIGSLADFSGQQVELSLDDKEELANFILTRDEAGDSEFDLMIRDPKNYVQIALWALRGNDILKEMNDQVKKAYNRGLKDGKQGQSSLVIDPNRKDRNKAQQFTGDNAQYLDVQ